MYLEKEKTQVGGESHWRHEVSDVEKNKEEDKHLAESRVPELESCCFSFGELLKHEEACYH